MQKLQRQNAILKIISDKRVGRQDELAAFLSQKGFSVTQASVSRDLVELGVNKSSGLYGLPEKHTGDSLSGLIAVESAGENLLIAKCGAGQASAAAVRIDAARLPEIVGTIAGDDTIFIAVQSGKTSVGQRSTMRKIFKIFE